MGNLFYDEPRPPKRDYVLDVNGREIRAGTVVRRVAAYPNVRTAGLLVVKTVETFNTPVPNSMDGINFGRSKAPHRDTWDADRFEVVDG